VTELVRGYGPQLLGYLVTLLRDGDLAAEVFGEVCEGLWRGIGGFERECSYRSWAYRIAWIRAQNATRQRFRRKERRLETTEISRLAEEIRSTTVVPADRFEKLRAALDPLEQTLLTLRIDKKMSWREVSDVMAADESALDEVALSKRFERVKRKLRSLAGEAGLLEP
jgi:RNA polymerase sigma-70 factor (ECF subfamily)